MITTSLWDYLRNKYGWIILGLPHRIIYDMNMSLNVEEIFTLQASFVRWVRLNHIFNMVLRVWFKIQWVTCYHISTTGSHTIYFHALDVQSWTGGCVLRAPRRIICGLDMSLYVGQSSPTNQFCSDELDSTTFLKRCKFLDQDYCNVSLKISKKCAPEHTVFMHFCINASHLKKTHDIFHETFKRHFSTHFYTRNL